MSVTVTHAKVTGAAANPNVLVDGPAWDAQHVITGLAASATTDTTNASNISSGTLPAAQLPSPTASTLGGVKSLTAVSHQFLTSIGTDGTPVQAQPAASDISGIGAIEIKLTGINFNSANTDYPISISLPAGVSRYLINGIRISHASASLTTATAGVFTGAGGTGTAIVTNSAMTVSTSADNTANNMQTLSIAISTTTTSVNYTTLYFRVGTAQGSAATADLSMLIFPLT